MKRRIPAVCLSLILALTLAGCSLFKVPGAAETTPSPSPTQALPDTGSASGGDRIFSLNFSSAEPLNPINGLTKTNKLASQLIYEGLFAVNAKWEAEYVLCETWRSDDGLVHRFTLKSGVLFHDGAELTAYDAAYSLEQARASALYSARLEDVVSVAVTGRYDLTVTLSRANMFLPLLLDVPVIQNGAGGRQNPAGTGPYSFQKAENYYYLQAFSSWRGGKTPLERIYLQEYSPEELTAAFEGGYVDMVEEDPTDSAAVIYGRGEGTEIPTSSLLYMGFNASSAVFSNVYARRAASACLDREYIAKTLMSGCGQAAYMPSRRYLPETETAAEALIRGDAAELVSLSGKAGGRAVLLVNRENPTKLAIARYLASELTKAGIYVSLSELKYTDYLAALGSGNFDFYLAECDAGADFDLADITKRGGRLNYGKLFDTELDALADVYFEYGGEEDAAAYYKALAEKAVIAPIAFRSRRMLTARGVVTGASPAGGNAFFGISGWNIDFG